MHLVAAQVRFFSSTCGTHLKSIFLCSNSRFPNSSSYISFTFSFPFLCFAKTSDPYSCVFFPFLYFPFLRSKQVLIEESIFGGKVQGSPIQRTDNILLGWNEGNRCSIPVVYCCLLMISQESKNLLLSLVFSPSRKPEATPSASSACPG